MAATNPNCFKKQCLCATCQKLCSRCFVPDDECKTGTEMCTVYKHISYDEYKEENSYSTITKEEYNELLRSVCK